MKLGTLTGLATAALLAVAGAARAEFPEKPITMLIGYAPGGGTDTVGRVLAKGMSEALGQPINVVNMPGAAGGVAATTLTAKAPDGYTILLAQTATITSYPLSNEALTYKPEDFTVFASVADFQPALVAPASAPYDSFDEFVAWAKENGPAKYAILTPTSRMIMELIEQQESIAVNYIPLRSGGDMVNGLMGKQFDIAYSGGVHQRYPDDIKALVSASGRKLVLDPDVPTLPELGYDIDGVSSFVVFGPAAVEADVRARLEAAVAEAFKGEDVQKVLTNTGFPARFVGGDEATAEMMTQYASDKKLIERMGAALQ